MTEADRADFADPQRERATAGVELRFAAHHDLGALGELDRRPVNQRRVAADVQRHVGRRVAQHHVGGCVANFDLGELTLDPDDAQPLYPTGHADGNRANRERVLSGTAGSGRTRHLAVARVILLANRVWNGARARDCSSKASSAFRSDTLSEGIRARSWASVSDE